MIANILLAVFIAIHVITLFASAARLVLAPERRASDLLKQR